MAALGLLGLGAAGLVGCSGQSAGAKDASTDCSVTSCTVTFDREATPAASTSLMGIKAELVSVKEGLVTLRVGGQTIPLPSDGSRTTTDGFTLSVTSLTRARVVVRIVRGGTKS